LDEEKSKHAGLAHQNSFASSSGLWLFHGFTGSALEPSDNIQTYKSFLETKHCFDTNLKPL
jgi:hypothetical protein